MTKHKNIGPGPSVRGTQRRGDQRRQRLLEAASQLIARCELTDVTYVAVCHEAGIPPSSAHHFYPDLDAIYIAIVDAHRTALDAALMHPLRPRDKQSWQTVVECLVGRAARYHHAHPIEAKLSLGDKIPPHLKRQHREADRLLARRTLMVLGELFVIPRIDSVEVVAFIATEIVDLVFTLSMSECQRITPKYLAMAKAGAVGFLSRYMGENSIPRPAAVRTK
jgi:AcrR family transcriptional regulator